MAFYDTCTLQMDFMRGKTIRVPEKLRRETTRGGSPHEKKVPGSFGDISCVLSRYPPPMSMLVRQELPQQVSR